MMAKAELQNIWLSNHKELDGRREIRFDWDNDRHQAVEVGPTNDPDSVVDVLKRAINIIEAESREGRI